MEKADKLTRFESLDSGMVNNVIKMLGIDPNKRVSPNKHYLVAVVYDLKEHNYFAVRVATMVELNTLLNSNANYVQLVHPITFYKLTYEHKGEWGSVLNTPILQMMLKHKKTVNARLNLVH